MGKCVHVIPGRARFSVPAVRFCPSRGSSPRPPNANRRRPGGRRAAAVGSTVSLRRGQAATVSWAGT